MSTSGAKGRYHHGDLREALVAAGLDILEEGGVGALTLREAARRAGVSAMAPYRHFADKEALLAGVAVVGFDRLTTLLRQADARADAREALVAQGVAYVTFACTNPALFRLMFGAGSWAKPGMDKPGVDATVGGNAYAILSGRVASLVPANQVADWTLACWSLVHGLAGLILDGRVPMPRDVAAETADRILRFFAIVT